MHVALILLPCLIELGLGCSSQKTEIKAKTCHLPLPPASSLPVSSQDCAKRMATRVLDLAVETTKSAANQSQA